VTNPVPVTAGARTSGGHGLIGMHERASLVGGTLDAGACDGEFRIGARLPYTGQRA
jgi:signal transduction histidine kinase